MFFKKIIKPIYLSNGFNAVHYISTRSSLQINNESKFTIFLRSALYDDEFRLSAVLKYGIFRANIASATKKLLNPIHICIYKTKLFESDMHTKNPMHICI